MGGDERKKGWVEMEEKMAGNKRWKKKRWVEMEVGGFSRLLLYYIYYFLFDFLKKIG